jgi:hypothetical protein
MPEGVTSSSMYVRGWSATDSSIIGLGSSRPGNKGILMSQDLWGPEHFAQKHWERVTSAKPADFLPWDEAREKYIAEKVEPLLATYRQSDHKEFKDFNRRRGVSMHSSDLIFRIQKLNPHIFVQQQYNFENDWGLYSSAIGRIQFLTGLPKGWLQEFSYSIVDERDLPLEERRGWRTVLIYLLMKGALTWEQVIAEFGEPNDAWNDARWQEVTADFRHGGDQLVQRNIANLVE